MAKKQPVKQPILFDPSEIEPVIHSATHLNAPTWLNTLLVELAKVVQDPTHKPGFIRLDALNIDGNDEWIPADKHRLTIVGNARLRRIQFKAPILRDGEPTGKEISLAAIQLNPDKSRRTDKSAEALKRDTMFYVILRRNGKVLKSWSNRKGILYNGSATVKLFDVRKGD